MKWLILHSNDDTGVDIDPLRETTSIHLRAMMGLNNVHMARIWPAMLVNLFQGTDYTGAIAGHDGGKLEYIVFSPVATLKQIAVDCWVPIKRK